MQEKRSDDQRRRMEDALERTTPADEFSPDSLARELERTRTDHDLEATPQQYLNRTASDMSETAGRDDTATITSFEESAEVLAELAPDGTDEGERRFGIVGQVGSGATSKVYAVSDRSLGRTIAVKFLRRQSMRHREKTRQRFLHEARVTATLEHPNIMPIHDIGTNPRGALYFTMKNITGTTLGDAIRAAREGKAVPAEFSTIDDRVRVFLKVCDALSYAHHRGYVHQDVKPDNIMLGEFGEVLLLDWGSALSALDLEKASGKAMYGTPAYMSPEQARREQTDARSDVYCLAATFFHALTLRHPTWSEDAEVFWERKRRGEIDELSPREQRTVPRALMAIVRKGLAADASQRYQSVADMAEELKRWQAGQAVRAYRENPVEIFVRWYRRNRRLFWVVAAATVLVGSVGTMLLQEKVKEFLTWRWYFSEDFSGYTRTAELAQNWQSAVSNDWWRLYEEPLSDSGTWKLSDGSVKGRFANGFTALTFARSVPGDIRVEWTVTPLVNNLNLNCFVGGKSRFDGYAFHIGGFVNDPTRCFLTRMRNLQPIDSGSIGDAPRLNEPTHLRMERERGHVRLYRDRRLVIDWVDDDPLLGPGHQTFGFECAYNNQLRIDDITVYYHPLPRKVSPLATADRFFLRGYFADAVNNYREIAQMYPGSELAATALYKTAVSLSKLDSTTAARQAFAAFEEAAPSHRLAPQALYERSKLIERDGDTTASHDLLRELGRRYPGHPALRQALGDMTGRRLPGVQAILDGDALAVPVDQAAVTRLLESADEIRQWSEAFGLSPAGNLLVARVCSALLESEVMSFEELTERFPEQRESQAYALVRQGEYERVLEEYPEQSARCGEALYWLGRWEDVLQVEGARRWHRADALLRMGELDEVLKSYPDRPSACAEALIRLGRVEEAMERYPGSIGSLYRRFGRDREYFTKVPYNVEDIISRLLALGRADTALALMERWSSMREIMRCVRQHEAYTRKGELETCMQVCPGVNGMETSRAHSALDMGDSAWAMQAAGSRRDVRADIYGCMGLFDSALALVRSYSTRKRTLMSMGAFDRLKALNLSGRWLNAQVLLLEQDYEQVLQTYPDQRPQAAVALLSLGRYDELRERHPDQRMPCAVSLLAEDRPDDALARYPECRPEHAQWLLEHGYPDTVVALYRDQPVPYSYALVDLHREDAIPWHTGLARPTRQDGWDIQAVHALRCFAEGEHEQADAILADLHLREYGYHQQRFAMFLLRPILAGLGGDTTRMRKLCRALIDEQPYAYAQRNRYDAAFLAGDMDESTYRSQPFRYQFDTRLRFFKAIRDDIAGNAGRAREAYAELLKHPHVRYAPLFIDSEQNPDCHTIFETYPSRRFMQWRVGVLGASSG